MKIKNDYLIDHLEWEVLNNNVEITFLSFEKEIYNLRSNCIIQFFRDKEYKLRATIRGIIEDRKDIEPDLTKLDGNFIDGEIITGFSTDGLYKYRLFGCVIDEINFRQISLKEKRISFQAELIVDEIEEMLHSEEQIEETEIDRIHEWYLGGINRFSWARSTKRVLKRVFQRSRVTVDEEIDFEPIETRSSSRDYLLAKCRDFSFIVAKVPDKYKPSWSCNISIEYRTSFGRIPTKEERQGIQEIVSFILGHQLLKIGETYYKNNLDKSLNFKLQKFSSPWGDNVISRCQKTGLPPVDIRGYRDGNKLEKLLNSICTEYLAKREKLQLGQILWKYWMAKYSVLGINLPILSSAIESLASKIIKENPNIKLYYIERNEFSELIEEELETIGQKLAKHEYKDRIINKIKSASNRGSNEKLDILFEILELEVGKIERKAIKARNKMAHSHIGNSSNHKIKELIRLSRAYETLFHRVFLKNLLYEENYIDYYTNGFPQRNIKDPIIE